MRKFILPALLLLAAASPQGREEDKIGNSKAPTATKKAVAASMKARTAAIKEDVTSSVNQQENKISFTGAMLRDFSGVRGAAEVYTFRTSTMARDSKNRLLPIDKLEDRDAVTATAYRAPATFLAEVARLAPKAGYGKTETVDGTDCKIVYLTADPALVKQQLKEVGDRVGRSLKAAADDRQRLFTNALFTGNLSSYFDAKKTRSAYGVWIGRKDLLIRRIEWTFTTELRENAFPGGNGLGNNNPLAQLQGINVTTRVDFSRWGEDPEAAEPARRFPSGSGRGR